MLDLNHVLATPGLDAQYFQNTGWTQALLISVSALATGGVLTVASSNYYVGQAIIFAGTIISGSITGYTPNAIYYIITVNSSTSITISASPGGAAVTSTASSGAPGITGTSLVPQFQTWRKPRGIKWVYLLGVGGGASGGTGVNTSTTSGGGAGGGSGSQTVVMIPAMFVPDTLYITCGIGGASQITSGVPGLNGTPTFVSIEANTLGLDFNKILLWANPGNIGGTAATTTAGGVAGTAAAAPTIVFMPLAGRGFYSQISGQAARDGSTSSAIGSVLTPGNSGLMVTAGNGGGGCNGATGISAASISQGANLLGQDYFPTVFGGSAAVTSTPAGNGAGGFIARNFMFNYGGSGGGGATITAGGLAGAGGNGAPGCGGGGSGGANTTNNTLTSGAGGPGFVLIVSW